MNNFYKGFNLKDVLLSLTFSPFDNCYGNGNNVFN